MQIYRAEERTWKFRQGYEKTEQHETSHPPGFLAPLAAVDPRDLAVEDKTVLEKETRTSARELPSICSSECYSEKQPHRRRRACKWSFLNYRVKNLLRVIQKGKYVACYAMVFALQVHVDPRHEYKNDHMTAMHEVRWDTEIHPSYKSMINRHESMHVQCTLKMLITAKPDRKERGLMNVHVLYNALMWSWTSETVISKYTSSLNSNLLVYAENNKQAMQKQQMQRLATA